MAHKISITGISRYLNGQEIRDLIDIFYLHEDTEFFVIFRNSPLDKNRGLHSISLEGVHVITINEDAIQKSFKKDVRIGGNYRAPNLKMAVAMVLVHEIQHSNQCITHHSNEIFFTRKDYKNRACEREARAYVDTNIMIIANLLNDADIEKQNIIDNEILTIVEILSLGNEISEKDIKTELRLSNILNKENVITVKSILTTLEITVV